MGSVSPLIAFDPIVLITRVMATVFGPLIRHSGSLSIGVLQPPPVYGDFLDYSTLLVFVGIMAYTTRVSRVWCRTACPLGAMLAVSSRYSSLKRDTTGCIHCQVCANHCPTGAIDFKNPEVYNESECIKCFSCSEFCPVDVNVFQFKNPINVTSKMHEPVELGRRELVSTLALAAVSGPIMQISAGKPLEHKKLMRPPMSREEGKFLSSCIRCGECMKACPTGTLKPADLKFGVRGLWSPVMTPVEGPCLEGCNACSVACPTDAIQKYPVEAKYLFKVGTAVLNTSLCVGYGENKFCLECVRACPTQAITVSAGWESVDENGKKAGSDTPAPEGQTASRPTHIDFDKCVGCGWCENVCNQIVMGEPAMIVTSFGRAVPTNLQKTENLI
jgi:ferredoxin